ncbi:MAG TPA: hypothetical protein VEK82_00955 [Stellaceae bacterium]|nr:hypothetical protein [Stellaceae bacterium]
MSASNLTRHAILRTSQRGIRPDDLELVECIGTEVESGTILLHKDAQAFERDAKKLIAQVCKRVVRAGDAIVTTYHASRTKERRRLRGADDRSLRR